MKPKMEYEQFENAKFNRYMEVQLKRLEEARVGNNPKLYFRICESLIKHSTVFFAWQLSQTDPL